MLSIRQRLLDEGNLLCPYCNIVMKDENTIVPIIAYAHKACVGYKEVEYLNIKEIKESKETINSDLNSALKFIIKDDNEG